MTTSPSGDFTLPPVVRSPELEQPLAYQAICSTCPDWLGQKRTSNLVALRDFERHVATMSHEHAIEAAENAAEDQRILAEMDAEAPHVGHYSRLTGTYWCDTCNSPLCESAEARDVTRDGLV